jgi:putative ABC transport system substrate-binding protein
VASGLLALLGCAPPQADRAATAKLPRIIYLSPTAPGEQSPFGRAFMEGLEQLGYVNGRNVIVDFKYTSGRDERFPELVAEALQQPADVIIGSTSPAVVAAKGATQTVPIVMVGVGDAVGTGLVASLSRPGGNVTGVTSFSPELSAKRLDLLKEAIPDLSRVGVLWNAGNPVKVMDWNETEQAAAWLGVDASSLAVRSPAEFAAAFEAAAQLGCGGLAVLGDPLTVQNVRAIVELAREYRLPAIYEGREFTDAGGLLSYAANRVDYYRRAATYVDRILKGETPADLPVERPARFELVVNLQTAGELGLTLPQSLLIRADRIIR